MGANARNGDITAKVPSQVKSQVKTREIRTKRAKYGYSCTKKSVWLAPLAPQRATPITLATSAAAADDELEFAGERTGAQRDTLSEAIVFADGGGAGRV